MAASEKREPESPVVRASARYMRMAPRKARLVADQVRGLTVPEAQTLLDVALEYARYGNLASAVELADRARRADAHRPLGQSACGVLAAYLLSAPEREARRKAKPGLTS